MQHLITTLGPIAEHLAAGELADLAQAIQHHGLRCIRPRVSLDQLPFETQAVPWTTLGRFLIDSNIRPGSFLQFAAGDYAVQDAASLLPLTLMQLQPDQTVIDCCAAPGGKSAAILERLDGRGLLVSNEVIASRIDTLQLTLARTGYSNAMLTHQSVDRLVDVMADQFDCVLVDAPCTGQSLVGRGKQSMSAFAEHQVAHSAARQHTILESALQLVRPGGRLVYSTCTFAFAENEGVMSWLRERVPDWQPVVLDELGAWETPGFAGCYRLWPHRDRCAGGFAAALLRPTSSVLPGSFSPSSASSNASSNASRRSSTAWQWAKEIGFMSDWCEVLNSDVLYAHKQQLAMFDPALPATWRALAHCGIELATRFGEHWQPAYSAAVLSPQQPRVIEPHRITELSDQEACTYFTGTSLHRSGPAGWQVVSWQGRLLGWAKQVGTQLKNHLPKPLRHPNLNPRKHTQRPAAGPAEGR